MGTEHLARMTGILFVAAGLGSAAACRPGTGSPTATPETGNGHGPAETAAPSLDATGTGSALTAEDAEARARSTEAVQAFLERYSPCEGCTIHDDPGDPPRIGCVSYRLWADCISGAGGACDAVWAVEYSVGRACSFRLGRSEQPLVVRIDRATGRVVGTSPEPAFVTATDHCETDADCRCLSGSGVPFLGCANSFHAPLHFAGFHECERCGCAEHRCIDRGAPEPPPGP